MEIITISKSDYAVYNPKTTMDKEKVTAAEKHVEGAGSDEATTFAIPAFVITLDVNKAIDVLYPVLGGMIAPAAIMAVGLGGLLLLVLATALLR